MKIRSQSKMPLKSLKSLICVWTQVECRRLNYQHYTWLQKVSFGIEANAMAHYQWVSKSKGQVAYNLFIEKSAIFSSGELAIWINTNWEFVIWQKLIPKYFPSETTYSLILQNEKAYYQSIGHIFQFYPISIQQCFPVGFHIYYPQTTQLKNDFA